MFLIDRLAYFCRFRNTSMGGMYKPGSYSGGGGYGERLDDDRYGGRDEDRNGYGRDRDWDSNGRDSDRHGRDSEERYGRDGYRDDDSRGRSRSSDPYTYGSRSRSADRDRDCSYEDDGQYSSRYVIIILVLRLIELTNIFM